jgi:hypothetical protein
VTNATELLAPISWLTYSPDWVDYNGGVEATRREHTSSPNVALDPRNTLSHDYEPLQDSVIEASSARDEGS